MIRLCQKFLLFLAGATDRDLVRQVEYLKTENRILRGRLPRKITVNPDERRQLLKVGRAVGAALKHLIAIVTPRTFARWLSGELGKKKVPARNLGRPKTPDDIRDLILRIAHDTDWGYTRILGELKKLGVKVCRSTVIAILKEHGLDPGPKRGEGTWSDFIRRHVETLWGCDFFSKKVWTMGGLVDVFVLFFIHVKTRQVYIGGVTAQPDEAWMIQQARNASMHFGDQSTPPKYIITDMDTKFTAKFRETLECDQLKVIRVGPKKPNLNAYAERFVQTIRTECLDHFVCFGIEHLQRIVKRFESFYNRHRPHQGVGNRTLPEAAEDVTPATLPFPAGKVACQEDLGGLLKHYYREAA